VLPNLVAASHIWRSTFQNDDTEIYLWHGILPLRRQSGYNLAVAVAKNLNSPYYETAERRIVRWGTYSGRHSGYPPEIEKNLVAEIHGDANYLKKATIRELQARPLWQLGEPEWASQNRMDFEQSLPVPIWEDWLDWYNRRVQGSIAKDRIEEAFVIFEPALFEGDYYDVNNEIRRRLGKEVIARPEVPSEGASIPDQRPAAVEPYWAENRLVLSTSAALSDLDGGALSAALHALQENLFALSSAAESESNIDKRAAQFIKGIAEGIPAAAPQQDQLFTIAHGLDWMAGYQSTVNEEWPAVLAAQYTTTALQFERTVRQFPRWREFVRNAQTDQIVSASEISATSAMTQEIINILQDSDASAIVDPSIPRALENLREWLVSENEPTRTNSLEGGHFELLAFDLLESIDNVAKRLGEQVLNSEQSARRTAAMIPEAWARLLKSQTLTEAWLAYRKAFAAELPEAMKRAGQEHARNLPSVMSAALLFLIAFALSGSGFLAAGVVGASAAARKFNWLGRIIELLKNRAA
jgi:hypothetical protein